MASNLQKLGPSEACRVINSTPLGDVVRESHIRNHRTQAGLSIGSQKKINLLAYAAWLVQQRHGPKPSAGKTPPPVNLQETAESALALVQQLRSTEVGKPLGDRQLRGIAALLTEPNHKAAALKVGVTPTTICRWLNQPEFQTALDQVKSQLHDSIFARAQGASGMVLDSLLQIAQHAPRNSDRIQAGRTILGLADRGAQRLSPAASVGEVPTMQARDVSGVLSSFIRQVEHSQLAGPEQVRLITSLTSTLLNAINTGDLQVRLEAIEDVLNTPSRRKPK